MGVSELVVGFAADRARRQERSDFGHAGGDAESVDSGITDHFDVLRAQRRLGRDVVEQLGTLQRADGLHDGKRTEFPDRPQVEGCLHVAIHENVVGIRQRAGFPCLAPVGADELGDEIDGFRLSLGDCGDELGIDGARRIGRGSRSNGGIKLALCGGFESIRPLHLLPPEAFHLSRTHPMILLTPVASPPDLTDTACPNC